MDYYRDTNELTEPVGGLVSEYSNYAYGRGFNAQPGNYEKSLRDLISLAFQNLEKFPAFTNFLEQYILEGEKENRYDELSRMEIEEYNDQFGTEFETKEQAEEEIDNMKVDESFEDYLYVEDVENFAALLSNYHDWEEILVEFYQNAVFPVWFQHWESEGIEATRDRIEEIYEELQKIQNVPINDQFLTINLATNATHQTGDMMDQYEQQYRITKNELDSLSDHNAEDWDTELRRMGVQR